MEQETAYFYIKRHPEKPLRKGSGFPAASNGCMTGNGLLSNFESGGGGSGNLGLGEYGANNAAFNSLIV
jgi:hypothetical protein